MTVERVEALEGKLEELRLVLFKKMKLNIPDPSSSDPDVKEGFLGEHGLAMKDPTPTPKLMVHKIVQQIQYERHDSYDVDRVPKIVHLEVLDFAGKIGSQVFSNRLALLDWYLIWYDMSDER